MTTKCTGLMGLIFGHKFKPVITLSASGYNTAGVNCKAHVALEMADKYRNESFHGCVCLRCGEFVAHHKEEQLTDEHPFVDPGVHGCTWHEHQICYAIDLTRSVTGEKK